MNIVPKNLEIRMARLEAISNKIRAEMTEALEEAYQKAVENKDEVRAAELARKIRNRMLEDSDKQCAFDKILPEAPTGSSFVDWISWLRHLASMNTNSWGSYRQAVRDLPKQEGFPFNIIFPIDPDKQKELAEEAKKAAAEEAAKKIEEEKLNRVKSYLNK